VWLTYAKTGWAIRERPGARAWQIFDQRTLHLLEPRYSTGIPVEADSLDGLAGKLGLPAARLRQTVADNYAAGSGLMRGATFGRIAGREAAATARSAGG
jgi:tricarballylate dehydrogenase